jgi:hypothetical protein
VSSKYVVCFFELICFLSYRCKIMSLWELWWLGNLAEQIGPYRRIRATYDIVLSDERKSFASRNEHSKAKKVIEKLTELSGHSAQALGDLDRPAVMHAFDVAFEALCRMRFWEKDQEYVDNRRPGDTLCNTVYNWIHEAKATKRPYKKRTRAAAELW